LALFEPDIPWRPDFLNFRLACYQALGSPLEAGAQKDLQRFLKQNPVSFPARLTEKN